ncbi:MAG: dTDP-3-amino-3,6-dideoxy-alpha-D-galactopyranose transaminase [Anaerolineae bacterium]|nr:dTDP-3-amino-3,6-dideoxy-alpha-D-galactopyranose transaminase [Anaerolineae bacterium]
MIPQSSPVSAYLGQRDEIDAAILRVLGSGRYILGNEVREFEREFAAAHRAGWAVGVASGTDAIEIALRVLGVGPGDGVLTVSHTAVATVAAIARIGAVPLFVDVDQARYTMSPGSLREALERTAGKARAVVAVHLYGQPAAMPEILALARAYALPVVEDCAQAHGASLDGHPVGTWGDLGCFSFYPTKNLGAFGDGGAVVGVDERHLDALRAVREYGWETRYVSRQFGVNSRLDELQAAVLRVRLAALDDDNRRRRNIADLYDEGITADCIIKPPRFPDAKHVFHQYVIQTPQRDHLQKALADHGVASLVHYPKAVHQQPAYDDESFQPVALPNTEDVVSRVLSLPMFPEMTLAQVAAVCAAVMRCLP